MTTTRTRPEELADELAPAPHPAPEDAAAHHGDPHLAHHFDSMPQQFEAAKLGMWLFLATEVLLFGGLFCLYAVFRGSRPEMFVYGSRFLDTTLGATNTIVLILSSMTMAIGVSAAQTDRRRLLAACLGLTILGGVTFLVIKYFEYEHKIHDRLVWGLAFYDEPAGAHAATDASIAVEPEVIAAADPLRGQALWMETCRACHGLAGEGIPGQGKDIRGSEFIAGKTDAELHAFVKVGRMPFDPLNTTGIQMPPKGGNPLLKDADLRDIVAYIRTFKAPAGDAVGAEGPAGEGAAAPAEEFWIPKSSIPAAAAGPSGLLPPGMETADGHGAAADVPHVRDPERPHSAHLFFGIYFLMTGLHGVHVLVGVVAISWLLWASLRGRFSASYYTPVDLVGLYWHVVDLIWIFLFPLFYLIH